RQNTADGIWEASEIPDGKRLATSTAAEFAKSFWHRLGPFAYNNPVAAGWLRPTARSMISTAGALMDEFSPKNLATTSQPEQPPQPVESPASFYANPQ